MDTHIQLVEHLVKGTAHGDSEAHLCQNISEPRVYNTPIHPVFQQPLAGIILLAYESSMGYGPHLRMLWVPKKHGWDTGGGRVEPGLKLSCFRHKGSAGRICAIMRDSFSKKTSHLDPLKKPDDSHGLCQPYPIPELCKDVTQCSLEQR